MLLTKASMAPTPIPTNLSGIESNQTMGHTTSASRASGQHSTNNMHQPTRKSSVLTGL